MSIVSNIRLIATIDNVDIVDSQRQHLPAVNHIIMMLDLYIFKSKLQVCLGTLDDALGTIVFMVNLVDIQAQDTASIIVELDISDIETSAVV